MNNFQFKVNLPKSVNTRQPWQGMYKKMIGQPFNEWQHNYYVQFINLVILCSLLTIWCAHMHPSHCTLMHTSGLLSQSELCILCCVYNCKALSCNLHYTHGCISIRQRESKQNFYFLFDTIPITTNSTHVTLDLKHNNLEPSTENKETS